MSHFALHLQANIAQKGLTTFLIAMFFCAGLSGTVGQAVWRVFVNLQAGNVIAVANRLMQVPSTHHPLGFTKSLTSMFCFLIGSLAYTKLHKMKERNKKIRRLNILVHLSIDILLSIIVAALAQAEIVSTRLAVGAIYFEDEELSSTWGGGSLMVNRTANNFLDLVPIALMSIVASGQVALSIYLLLPGLNGVAITILAHNFIADLLRLHDDLPAVDKANRQISTVGWKRDLIWRKWKRLTQLQLTQLARLACITAYVLGAFVGGGMLHMSREEHRGVTNGLAGSLWLVACIRVVLVVLAYRWPAEKCEDSVRTKSVKSTEGDEIELAMSGHRLRIDGIPADCEIKIESVTSGYQVKISGIPEECELTMVPEIGHRKMARRATISEGGLVVGKARSERKTSIRNGALGGGRGE